MDEKKERSYAKESTKSKPTGVRFDLEKLDLVKSREKLNTNQKVVDFLLNKYWWEHKIAVPTHKEAPPLALKAETVQSATQEIIAPKIDQYAAYEKEIHSAGSISEVEAIVRELKKDTIPDWQKNKLEKIGIEKSKTFDF